MAAYASSEPWRSRWSGWRFVRTATRAGASARPRAGTTTARRRPTRPRRRPCRRATRAAGRCCRRPRPSTPPRRDRAQQRGGGRLPVRPCDAEDRVGEEARAELDLRDHHDPARPGRHDGRRLVRHARALDDELDAVEQRIGPFAERDVRRQLRDVQRGIGVVGDHLGTGAAGPARPRAPIARARRRGHDRGAASRRNRRGRDEPGPHVLQMSACATCSRPRARTWRSRCRRRRARRRRPPACTSP